MKPLHWTINTRNGREVKLMEFPPLTSGNTTLILCPQIGWPLSKYQSLLLVLQESGIRTLSFDDRLSPEATSRFPTISIHEWATQGLDAIILFARQRYAKNELVLFSHGLSAQFIGFSPASVFFQKMIFLNSCLSSRNPFSWWQLLGITIKAALFPLNSFFNQSTDPPLIKKGILQSLRKWSSKPNGLFDLFPDNNYRKLKMPILALNSSSINQQNAEKLLGYFPAASVFFQNINPRTGSYYQSGFNSPSIFPLSRDIIGIVVAFLMDSSSIPSGHYNQPTK